MATRPISLLEDLPYDALITREEIGVLAGSTRPEGEKHLTVNMWLHRYGPLGSSKPTFPESVMDGDGFSAKHRVGDVMEWLVATGRMENSEARGQFLTKIQVCDLLRIRPATLKSWVFKGTFPEADARQGRYARWERDTVATWMGELDQWIETCSLADAV